MEEQVAQRVARWWEVIHDLLQEPRTEFPVELLVRTLTATFDVTGVFWDWRASRDSFGLTVAPGALHLPPEFWDLWEAGVVFDVHPLPRWYQVTRDARPQTASRVPESLVARRADHEHLTGLLRTFDCEEQLTVPCRCHGTQHEAFVLARTGSDFSDDDLAVAHIVQPVITAVHRQVDMLHRLGVSSGDSARDLGLTGRELVVLQLLADGHSARGIARRLASSPRTIEKHLEHIYRKIDVHDRVNAVRLAQRLGLLSDPRAPE
jgi:DNA-binding CsgD family transcriptional regulator